MSISIRYRVVPSSIEGRFAVYDTSGQCIVHDGLTSRAVAFARAKGLNLAVTPKAPTLVEVACNGCGSVLLTLPGGTTECPQCIRDREAIEARIDWEETRARELEEARRSLEVSIEEREFVGVGDRWDGLS